MNLGLEDGWIFAELVRAKRLPGTQESWGLFGVGRVGSQALVGIPYVYKLRRHLEIARFNRVWPFETLFTQTLSVAEGPVILHAEIWPGVVKQRVEGLKDEDSHGHDVKSNGRENASTSFPDKAIGESQCKCRKGGFCDDFRLKYALGHLRKQCEACDKAGIQNCSSNRCRGKGPWVVAALNSGVPG